MTLQEIGAGYRSTADTIRHRIQELEEQPVHTQSEKFERDERVRSLKQLRRELQEVAVVCEKYYEKGRRRNERYCL